MVNSPELLIRLAHAGTGIAAVSQHFVEAAALAGELLPVLPDWRPPPEPAWAVFPGRRLMPARTRVLLDMMQEAFSPARCQTEVQRIEAAVMRR